MIEWIEQHREILGWLAGGMATAAGGAWVVVRYLLDRSRDRSLPGPPDKWQPAHAVPRSEAPEPASGTTVSTGTGIAAAGGMQIGGNVSIEHNRIPRGALVLAALGLLLLGYTAFNSGSHITVRNGSAVGGSVTNSTISVTPSR
jgi:hypothetical protein